MARGAGAKKHRGARKSNRFFSSAPGSFALRRALVKSRKDPNRNYAKE